MDIGGFWFVAYRNRDLLSTLGNNPQTSNCPQAVCRSRVKLCQLTWKGMDMNTTTNHGAPVRVTAKVLIVCDDLEVGRIWAHGLRGRNFDVSLVANKEEVISQWEMTIPDLIVIDLKSTEQDGIALCQALRMETITPILMLTDQQGEAHILAAYQAGVDECVPKPVSPAIFLAKVTAWLRRSWTLPAEALDGVKAGGLRLDPVRRILEDSAGLQIKLTNLEFRLLHVLMTNPGWTLETEDLVERVWGYQGDGDSNLLKNVVYRLRRKLETDLDNPSLILTDPGVGYKFHPG